MLKILIVDDEENIRIILQVLLKKEGYEVIAIDNGAEALRLLRAMEFDFAFLDVRMPGIDGLTLLKKATEEKIATTFIVMSAYGTFDTTIEALKLGAYDYINKPFKGDEVILTLKKAEERERLKRENKLLKHEITRTFSFDNIIGKSEKMMEIYRLIRKIADYKTTVLITGDSGTGKELIARSIHFNSARSAKPFVVVNCGAIPEKLLESELFGYVQGAFTDANRDKTGLFEESSQGTIFLDEIGELPLALQVKLLRVLQEEEIRRLGDNADIKVNLRVIAATARNLAEEAEKGNFREDLFYRLNVLQIQIPPLRERKEDIPILVEHFIDHYNQKFQTQIKPVSPEILKILMNFSWPGNVRELENTIERGIVLANGQEILKEDLPEKLLMVEKNVKLAIFEDEYSVKKTLPRIEAILIRRALEKTKGNKSSAARILEISHRALLYKIKEYGIDS